MTLKQETEKRQSLMTTAHHDFEKGLRARAFFKVHNKATSDDLVQDTFMKTWSYLVKGGKIDLMKAFLYHILNNLIIDEYRKRKTTSLEELLEKGFQPASDHARIFDVLDGKATMLLIKHLPDNYQKVIRMRYAQDLSLDEISILTGETKNAVAVKMHRGLKKLRELYEHRV